MKISFRESGGFAGLYRGTDLDSETLAAQERQRIERLVASLPEPPRKAPPPLPDVTSYEIRVEDGTGSRVYHVDDMGLTKEFEKLIGALQKHAKPLPLP